MTTACYMLNGCLDQVWRCRESVASDPHSIRTTAVCAEAANMCKRFFCSLARRLPSPFSSHAHTNVRKQAETMSKAHSIYILTAACMISVACRTRNPTKTSSSAGSTSPRRNGLSVCKQASCTRSRVTTSTLPFSSQATTSTRGSERIWSFY